MLTKTLNARRNFGKPSEVKSIIFLFKIIPLSTLPTTGPESMGTNQGKEVILIFNLTYCERTVFQSVL
jgi:hypothetical protein